MRFASSEKQDKRQTPVVLCTPLAAFLPGRLTRLAHLTIILVRCLPVVRSVGTAHREVYRYVFLIGVLVFLLIAHRLTYLVDLTMNF
jgi:hypothetical protein